MRVSFAAAVSVAAALFPVRTLAWDVELTLGVESTSVFRGYRAQRLNPNPYAFLEVARGAVYAGVYAAPVAFGEEENALVLGYGGVTPSLAGFDLDIGVGYYAFPDSHIFEVDIDGDGLTDHSGRKGLLEPYAGATRAFGGFEIEAFAFYTPDSLGETGPGWYGSAEVAHEVVEGFSLVAGYGVSRFDNDLLSDDYDDWRVAIERPLFGFDLKLRYSDTVGALGLDNRTLSLVVERPFGLFSSRRVDGREEKIRNRWIIDKCRLGAARR